MRTDMQRKLRWSGFRLNLTMIVKVRQLSSNAEERYFLDVSDEKFGGMKRLLEIPNRKFEKKNCLQ